MKKMFADPLLENRSVKEVLEKSLGTGNEKIDVFASASRTPFERTTRLPTGRSVAFVSLK
jgi:hypothetical protein